VLEIVRSDIEEWKPERHTVKTRSLWGWLQLSRADQESTLGRISESRTSAVLSRPNPAELLTRALQPWCYLCDVRTARKDPSNVQTIPKCPQQNPMLKIVRTVPTPAANHLT
ncbi:hypothetical protein AVEN_219277-1, partial [Araneus ventricosus]